MGTNPSIFQKHDCSIKNCKHQGKLTSRRESTEQPNDEKEDELKQLKNSEEKEEKNKGKYEWL